MAGQVDPALLSQLQGSGPGGMPTQADAQAAQAKEAEKESMRQDMLTKVMAPDAKERLARISLVKPDKVRLPRPARRKILACHSRARHATGPQARGDGDDDGAAWAAARAAFGRAAEADARADWRRRGVNKRTPPTQPPLSHASMHASVSLARWQGVAAAPKVQIDRRRAFDDDDSDIDLDGL